MDITTHGKMRNKKHRGISLLLSSLMLLPVSAFTAPPAGMMGQHMENSGAMRQMMDEGGYGYGYGYGRGYGYPGWMGRMGPMMGPMGEMNPMMMGSMGGMMGGMGPIMGGLWGLDLSKDQREKIRNIQHSMRQENFELMSKMMDSADKLAELYDADKPDPDKIGKAYDEIYKIKREMIQQHIRMRNKIYDLLTEDQRKSFKSHLPYGRMGMGMGMGMMH